MTPNLKDTYSTIEPADISDALSEAARRIRLDFTQRAAKDGADDSEVRRLMGCHKSIVGLLEAERRPVK